MEQQENQAANTDAPQTQEIRIGFEAALDTYNPQWREILNAPTVEAFRHFYKLGIRDTSVFANGAITTLSEGYAWLDSNVAATQLPEPTAAEPAGTAVPEATIQEIADTATTTEAVVEAADSSNLLDTALSHKYPDENTVSTVSGEVAEQQRWLKDMGVVAETAAPVGATSVEAQESVAEVAPASTQAE